jgi:hypothetical protein
VVQVWPVTVQSPLPQQCPDGQTQLPPEHCLPLVQSLLEQQLPDGMHEVPQIFWPEGHWQAPPEQICPPMEQVWQPLPPVPQAPVVLPGRQLLLEQQPFMQEVELHTQAPLTHCWPLAQGPGLLPHLQPLEVQLSATKLLQLTQPTPIEPQVGKPGVTQLLDWQQPLHAFELHWHTPLTHCWPGEQGEPPPQAQAPEAEQLSALMPQIVHELPVWPQAPVVLPGWHWPLWQQPPLHALRPAAPQKLVHTCVEVLQLLSIGQSPATLQPQVPPRQRWPFAESKQLVQPEPLVPQALSLEPRPQVEPAQQPPLHGCETLQLVVQACAAALQARLELQSPAAPQPQAPPPEAVSHTWPIALPRQVAQTSPIEPQAVVDVPVKHTPPEAWLQQPWLHGWLALQALVQVCVPRSQALCTGQSLVWVQPQAPVTQAWPLLLLLQSRQALPALPQLAGTVPALQVPLRQQPPLHGCEALHELVQMRVALSQAEPVLQSPAEPQPQVPPPVTVRQIDPCGLDEQGAHAPPPLPQAAGIVPATHEPAWQQPPLHSCVGLQAVVQVFVPRSQARPAGQSAALLQPQLAARHKWPLVEVVQSTHSPAGAPQALLPVPAAHNPFEQQAPLHGCTAEQPVVHAWAVLSQAAPELQSPALLQPQEPPPATVTQAEPTPFPAQL